MNKEINVLALVKGEERYVFLYDETNRTETLRMLGRFAADPQLSFSWYDAALLSKKIREMAAEDASLQQHELNLQPAAEPARCVKQPAPQPRFTFRHEQDMI
jgi:hypothetical protein